MLIYDQFVFLHVPKTGGMFLTDAFADLLGPPAASLERHSGWDEIPAWAAGRPVLMYVRDPWDWDVSWYRYLTESAFKEHPPDVVRADPWVQVLFGDEHDFATIVKRACGGLDLEHPALIELLERHDAQAQLVAAGHDFYSAELRRIAGAGCGSDLLTVGRFESLFDDLERFSERNGIGLDAGALERLRARPAINASAPDRPHRDRYDDELRELVGRSCHTLTERFGYRF